MAERPASFRSFFARLGRLTRNDQILYWMTGGEPLGVAQAIESVAYHGGRMPLLGGLGAAFTSAASIGVGASVGREGPDVHLGALHEADAVRAYNQALLNARAEEHGES